jgi:hypothetical protein
VLLPRVPVDDAPRLARYIRISTSPGRFISCCAHLGACKTQKIPRTWFPVEEMLSFLVFVIPYQREIVIPRRSFQPCFVRVSASASLSRDYSLLFYLQTTPPPHPNLQICPFQHYSLPVMATLAPPSPSQSPTRMPRKWARKCERYCCLGATYFPLVFVYSITSWAVWVEATIGFLPAKTLWIGILSFSLRAGRGLT